MASCGGIAWVVLEQRNGLGGKEVVLTCVDPGGELNVGVVWALGCWARVLVVVDWIMRNGWVVFIYWIWIVYFGL